MRPEWTPHGQWIAFPSTRADKATRNIYWQRADGTGEAERLEEKRDKVAFIENFFEELRRVAPAAKK